MIPKVLDIGIEVDTIPMNVLCKGEGYRPAIAVARDEHRISKDNRVRYNAISISLLYNSDAYMLVFVLALVLAFVLRRVCVGVVSGVSWTLVSASALVLAWCWCWCWCWWYEELLFALVGMMEVFVS